MSLSYQYGFGKVTGGFALAVGDAYDLDHNPDAKPAEGTVTFRPQVSRIVIPGERIVTPAPIECSLDAGGYLYLPSSVTPGEDGTVPAEDQGVYLVANDTTDASPTGWTYEVTVALNGQAQWKFSIAVTTDSVQDISALVPVDSDGGTPVLRGPRGVGIESITDTDGDGLATVTYTDTTTSDLPLPQGPKGDPGKDGTQLVSYDQIDTLPDYPATFPPSTHTHPISQVDGLQGALDGKQPTGDYATVSQVPTTPGDIGAQPAGDYVSSTTITQIVALTQAEYDALTPDPTTLYVITVEWSMSRLTWQHGCDPRCRYKRAGSCPHRRIDIPDWQESRQVEGALWLLRPKSRRSWRRVVMAPMLHEIMRRHLASTTEGLVWGVVDPRDDYEAWRAALDKAGLPHVPLHSLRHTTATLLYALGVPEQTRMEILGHSSAMTTAGYTHVDLTMQRDAMRELGSALALEG